MQFQFIELLVPYLSVILISILVSVILIIFLLLYIETQKTPQSMVLFISSNFFALVKGVESEETVTFKIEHNKGKGRNLVVIKDKDTHPYLYRKTISMKRVWISIEGNPHTVDLPSIVYLLDASRVQQMISYFKDKSLTQSTLSKYRRGVFVDIMSNLTKAQLKNTITMFLFGLCVGALIIFILITLGAI